MKTVSNLLSAALRLAAFAVSAGCPIWVIIDKFPLWSKSEGVSVSIGGGAILVIAVAVITFRKVIFAWIKERLGLNTCPPVVFWLVGFFAMVGLGKITTIIDDLTTVCMAGLVGSGIGYFLVFAAGVIERRSE
ncbi:MAG: hypothetical protein E7589_01245 [Ruminococcaceae bacterium]|nr:hypothetical protein [Oscillospiraceae bacterium]